MLRSGRLWHPHGLTLMLPGNPNPASYSPGTGSPGATVTINGTGFGAAQGAGSVTFGGVAATITSWGANQIVCTVPTQASYPLSTAIVVINNAGRSATVGAFTTTAAYLNLAAGFTAATSQLLRATNTAALALPNRSFSWCAWVYLNSKAAERAFLSLWNTTGNQRAWVATYDNLADRFRWYISTDGSSASTLTDSHLGSPSTGTWYFLAGTYNFGTSVMSLSINNGTVDTLGSIAAPFNSSALLYLSTYNAGANGAMDGRLDSVGIWAGKTFTAAEITALYNSGVGVAYTDLATINGGSLSAPSCFYNLDDAGGSGATWVDSTGTASLTAGTGTAAPTSVAGVR